MLFNSFEFVLFFPIVTFIYFCLPTVITRSAFLLLASCFFYMWLIPKYILILVLTIVVDYFAALLIEKTEGGTKKFYLIASIICTCLILFYFKYYNFAIFNMNFFAEQVGAAKRFSTLDIILPVGLSFHTFQSLSYVIEVYRGNQKPEKNFIVYSLYVMYFPQLVAGPIERPQNLLHQFWEKHKFDMVRFQSGMGLILIGLFKKVVVADRLSAIVDTVYNAPQGFAGQGIAYVISTIFFAFQIYADFSGYSDIARGTSRILGIELMVNFRQPYFALSVSEFWRRWHMSLSTWFKDYLYLPLGGRTPSQIRTTFNLLVTFVVSGLWHGANWTYIIWGGLNGLYLSVFSFLGKTSKLPKLLQLMMTFVLICISWIFFRAATVTDAFYIVKQLGRGYGPVFSSFYNDGFAYLGAGTFMGLNFEISSAEFNLTILSLLAMLGYDYYVEKRDKEFDLSLFSSKQRGAYYATVVALIYILGVFGKNQFIYFQF